VKLRIREIVVMTVDVVVSVVIGVVFVLPSRQKRTSRRTLPSMKVAYPMISDVVASYVATVGMDIHVSIAPETAVCVRDS
jgi:hypothetical protein